MATDSGILMLHNKQLKVGKIPIIILPGIDTIMHAMAESMVKEIEENNEKGKLTLFIIPVGPVKQYPYFVQLVNQKRLSLKRVTFINMDEYMESPAKLISKTHPLSFRRFMEENCYKKIDADLLMPESQRIFPSLENADLIEQVIANHGGVDICFGGIGINGHIAFNEPPEEGEQISETDFMNLSVRVQKVSRETKVVNSISDLDGAYDNIPDYCITVGFKQILAARKIHLYCFRNWQRSVIRKASFGERTVQFPVSLLQTHKNTFITIPQELA